MAELLIANGADIEARDIQNDTPLHLALHHTKKALAELLLDHGADIEAKGSPEMNRTPIYHAETTKQVSQSEDLVAMLLLRGARQRRSNSE